MQFRFFANLALVIALGTMAQGETVNLTDGRMVTLNADGTYEFVELETVGIGENFELKPPFFEAHAGEYNRNRVRFMPILKNLNESDIVGFKFSTSFQNAFGDEIFSFEGESSERISTDSLSTANLFYYFEDNQFIPNEAYDLLLPLATSGTARIETTITSIAYSDGTVLSE